MSSIFALIEKVIIEFNPPGSLLNGGSSLGSKIK